MRNTLLRKHAYAVIAASLFALPLSAWSASHTVNVGQNSSGGQANAFNPSVVNATVGDTVTFTNVGASPGFHNVRSDGPTQTFRCANGCDGVGSGDGSPSATNWTSTITLTAAGTIQFYCEIHGAPGAGMSGTINVTLPVELQSFEVD
jgi:plastocyanin